MFVSSLSSSAFLRYGLLSILKACLTERISFSHTVSSPIYTQGFLLSAFLEGTGSNQHETWVHILADCSRKGWYFVFSSVLWVCRKHQTEFFLTDFARNEKLWRNTSFVADFCYMENFPTLGTTTGAALYWIFGCFPFLTVLQSTLLHYYEEGQKGMLKVG